MTLLESLRQVAWENPFAKGREVAERRVLGEGYQPLGNRGGLQYFSSNLEPLLKIMRGALGKLDRLKRPLTDLERTGYDEVVAFIHFHELIPEMDRVVDGASPRMAWRKFQQLMIATRQRRQDVGQWMPDEQLFAFFFQARRAFRSIDRYVIGETEPAMVLRKEIWESIFGSDLRRYAWGFFRKLSEVHTLISGPSGSGKELVAQAIGLSRYLPFERQTEQFVARPEDHFLAVNLAALPSELMESELFGHAKGAFTGAWKEREGYFESSGEWGTVFLDEIGEVSLFMQAKLLRVLQSRTFRRVGENDLRQFRGRVVAATNRDPEEAVATGKMREDLFFRLNGDRIRTRGLKELIDGKVEKLEPMLRYILGKNVVAEAVPDLVCRLLEIVEKRLGPHYPWPGNFRELEQFTRRVLVHGTYEPVIFQERLTEDFFWSRAKGLQLDYLELLGGYARRVRRTTRSDREAANRLKVDPRTFKKWLRAGEGFELEGDRADPEAW
ncbi:MAG: sigma 54-interacting transcriptional regulator [Puniceicoccaceae bacterium]